MNTRRLIERLASWPATLTLCLLIVLGALAVKLWPRTVPFEQCSEVYKKYAGVDGVDATFLKDFRVNDSVAVDVVLLEARTDSAWGMLLQEFNITPPPQEVIENFGETDIVSWSAPKKNHSLPTDSIILNNDLICLSWTDRRISVFSIETMQQRMALLHNQIKESTSNEQIPNNEQHEQNN